VALIVVAVIAFGIGTLTREEHFQEETYFEESVQGLAVGSHVKHLSVEIARVGLITFADQVYDIEITNRSDCLEPERALRPLGESPDGGDRRFDRCHHRLPIDRHASLPGFDEVRADRILRAHS